MSRAESMEGNQNAAKRREVESALRKFLVRDEYKKFHAGIESVMASFESGEKWAVEFVRDTLDGKPSQQLQHTGKDGEPIEFREVVRRIV